MLADKRWMALFLCASALVGRRAAADVDHAALIRETLGTSVRPAVDANRIDVDLPDLESGTDVEIVADNVRALAALYLAAELEELKFFAVVDKVAERFGSGTLPLGRGDAGTNAAGPRLPRGKIPEADRRALYASTLGGPRPSGGASPNRDFDGLMTRFVSAVSSYDRSNPALVEQLREASRDLAVNLSLHGYGAATYAAALLQDQIREGMSLLARSDVLSAYGARDEWAVIDKVSTEALGGAPNAVKHRTMAAAGARLLGLLADGAATGKSGLDAALASPTAAAGARAWLAASGAPRSSSDENPKATSPRPTARELAPLCFDASRRLVPCKVHLKKPALEPGVRRF